MFRSFLWEMVSYIKEGATSWWFSRTELIAIIWKVYINYWWFIYRFNTVFLFDLELTRFSGLLLGLDMKLLNSLNKSNAFFLRRKEGRVGEGGGGVKTRKFSLEFALQKDWSLNRLKSSQLFTCVKGNRLLQEISTKITCNQVLFISNRFFTYIATWCPWNVYSDEEQGNMQSWFFEYLKSNYNCWFKIKWKTL